MQKKSITKSKRNLLSDAVKASVDSKLTQAALILEYAFEYDVNFKERTILISGDIDQSKFDILEAAMTEMESQNRKSITVRLNSPGGEVYQALAIIGRFRRSPCNIVTEGYGHVMSAATLVLASGDKRRISKYAFFMHHESSYSVDGKHSEIKREVKQMEREDSCWAQWMEDVTKRPKDFWIKTGVGVNAYFDAEELLELGVVDEIF